jgi:hypothetical protein
MNNKAPKIFPTFKSSTEAEQFSGQANDAYFEICYHIEGKLNLCLQEMLKLYRDAPPGKRPKMQTGIVRNIFCPEGWPKNQKTLVYILLSLNRFRHEDTCHAYTINEAMTAFVLEREFDGHEHGPKFDKKTFEPGSQEDAQNMRRDLLRICDWIESRLHWEKHNAWYQSPDSFSEDGEIAHLTNLGIIQRHLAKFSERDRKRWEEMHLTAAVKNQSNLKMWTLVGKAQHDPAPRTWTHPEVDDRVIGIWPLVERYNWTYSDLLKVLEKLLPPEKCAAYSKYPLDSPESLKVHCRTICGLTKSSKGRSTSGMPNGWQIAQRLFRSDGK